MLVQTKAIVLHCSQYNARYTIANVYSRDYGRLGILVPYKRRVRAGHHLFLSSLTEVELTIELKPRRNLAYLRESHLISPRHTMQSMSIKCSQVMFLGELMYRILTHTEPDDELYCFLSDSLNAFEKLERGIANFYLYFTYRLLHYLSVAPEITPIRRVGYWFDLVDGCYVQQPPIGHQCLPPNEAEHLVLLSRMTLDNLVAYRYNRVQRGIILDRLLLFYRLHLPPFGPLRSLEILRSASSVSHT